MLKLSTNPTTHLCLFAIVAIISKQPAQDPIATVFHYFAALICNFQEALSYLDFFQQRIATVIMPGSVSNYRHGQKRTTTAAPAPAFEEPMATRQPLALRNLNLPSKPLQDSPDCKCTKNTNSPSQDRQVNHAIERSLA